MPALWGSENLGGITYLDAAGGGVFAAYSVASATASVSHVLARMTTDVGSTWTSPVVVASNCTLATPPAAAAVPEGNGRLRVFYVAATGTLTTRYSDDGGRTWNG